MITNIAESIWWNCCPCCVRNLREKRLAKWKELHYIKENSLISNASKSWSDIGHEESRLSPRIRRSISLESPGLSDYRDVPLNKFYTLSSLNELSRANNYKSFEKSNFPFEITNILPFTHTERVALGVRTLHLPKGSRPRSYNAEDSNGCICGSDYDKYPNMYTLRDKTDNFNFSKAPLGIIEKALTPHDYPKIDVSNPSARLHNQSESANKSTKTHFQLKPHTQAQVDDSRKLPMPQLFKSMSSQMQSGGSIHSTKFYSRSNSWEISSPENYNPAESMSVPPHGANHSKNVSYNYSPKEIRNILENDSVQVGQSDSETSVLKRNIPSNEVLQFEGKSNSVSINQLKFGSNNTTFESIPIGDYNYSSNIKNNINNIDIANKNNKLTDHSSTEWFSAKSSNSDYF